MNNDPLYVIYESHTRTVRELQRSIVNRWYNTQYLATSFWFIFFCNSFFFINFFLQNSPVHVTWIRHQFGRWVVYLNYIHITKSLAFNSLILNCFNPARKYFSHMHYCRCRAAQFRSFFSVSGHLSREGSLSCHAPSDTWPCFFMKR